MDPYAVDVSWLCRVFFTTMAVSSVAGVLAPSFRSQIMNYGSRGTAANETARGERREGNRATPSEKGDDAPAPRQPLSILNALAALQVPHAWFTYFYVASVASSIFWAYQIVTQGIVFRALVSHHLQTSPSDADGSGKVSGMTINQAVLAWSFMALQGTRRLYESITLGRPSKAKMWIGLWVIGVAYYLFMGISVWIEGIDALSTIRSPTDLLTLMDISKPSMKTFVAVPIFILATGIQHDCHVYLAGLKKYTFPDHPLFRAVLCPHYTAECFIYVAISIVAAPPGRLVNDTVLSGILFVVTNLGVTADSTWRWYKEKFGAERVEGRRRMMPYVY